MLTRKGWSVPQLKFRRFLKILLTNDSWHIMHDTWHKIWNHSSQSCLRNKQIQSSFRIHKFKFKFEPLTYFPVLQSFRHAQNSSAVGSCRRPDSSTAITFCRLYINKSYIVLRSEYSLARHVLLVCDTNVRGMTPLNVCTGPLKGTSAWDLTRLTIIEKPMTSLGHAAYARCWRRSEEILTLQK